MKSVKMALLFQGLEYTPCIPKTLHWSADNTVYNINLSACQEARHILLEIQRLQLPEKVWGSVISCPSLAADLSL